MVSGRKRGWCPTLDQPMASGDGLLVRVKPPGACLTVGAARGLAVAAERYGNGVIELTQRGNLQVRGLAEGGVGAFAQAVRDLGLALPAEQEGRRAVLAPPLLGEDPGLHPRAAELTGRLEAGFLGDPRLAGLPGKFAVSIEAGGVFAGYPVAADLTAFCDGRLCLARRGTVAAPVGVIGYDAVEGAFGLAPPFGQFDAEQLLGLAGVAEEYGTTLRVTPWRAILLARVPRARGAAIAEAAPYFITAGDDPRLLITACVGAPGCASATVATRRDAALLRPGFPVHVSGCAKGCAHPGPARVTLVGREGRYDLVRDGRAGDAPGATGLMMDAVWGLGL